MNELAAGFYGKIPSRGDFVRAGLRRDFIDAWDSWMQQGFAASREALGADWLPAWLEAPIWHFAIAPGLCGSAAAVGVFLPSVDRAGRHFPLVIAATAGMLAPHAMAASGAGFLVAAEAAGLAALEQDLDPEALGALVTTAALCPGAALPEPLAALPDRESLWWTAGSPRVAACALHHPALPAAEAFAGMLMQSSALQTCP